MAQRFLIVEGDAENLARLERHMTALGFAAEGAKSAAEAIERCERGPFDVVLVDAMLPDKSGIALLGELRALPSTERAAILFTIPLGDQEQRLWGTRAGADEILEKPYDLTVAATCARYLLRLREAERAEKQHLEDLDRLAVEHRLFLESLVHDLKNPIAVVHVNLAWVADRLRIEQADLIDALADAQEGIGRLQKMVDDLSMAGMMEQSRLPLKRERIEVTELLGQVIKANEREARARNVSLSLSLPEDLDIEGDATVLERVVHNLVESSLRHTPSSGKIELSARSGAGIEISVSGSGRPGAASDATSTWERASAAPESGPLRSLSLYFCKRAVEAHDGELDVIETPEWPTSVVMRLPAKRTG